MRDLYDRGIRVWWGTLIECRSGLAHRERTRAISSETGNQALRALSELSEYWTEVEPVEAVRVMARSLLGVHDLRAADSLPLAASKEGLDALREG